MSLLRKIKRKLAPKKKTEADRISAQREKQVLRVMAKTGWDHDYTYEKMLQAHNTIGCKFSEYYKFGLYSYPDEELDFQYRVALDHKEAKKQRLENRVIVVMDNTGWTREKALEHIEMVKEEYGINSEDYVKYQLYNAPEDGFLQYYADKQAEEKAAYQAKKEDCVQKVMKKTGWNHQLAKSKMNTCIKRTHCTPKEYVTYRMYDLTEEEQDKVFLAYHSKQIMAKYDVSKNFITVLRNKELTNEMFSDLIKRAWCVNNKVSLEEFKSTFKDSTKIIYKPVGGHRGFGVETFELSPDTIDDVYNKLKDYPTGVVEEYVKQHPEINKICASSVNTIRIVTISSVHRPVTNDGKMFDIAYVAFRIGGGTSIVDNFHSGGMVAAVDKNTGIILTDAADGDGNVFKTHPVTGTKIKGFQIPYFKEAIDMVTKECQKHKIENYIGWDMAISETGPELIEVNDRPGVVLISTPFAAEKIGVKPEMEKYLPVDEEKLRADAKRTAQREKHVQRVMAKTGWDHDYTYEKMLQAHNTLGCKFSEYNMFRLFKYADEDMEAVYIRGKKKQEAKKAAAAEKEAKAVESACADSSLKEGDLSKYELKAPDYDLIDRQYNPEFDVPREPLRYRKNGDNWVAKNNKGNSTARIMFTGDITCFEKQMETSLTDGTYNFDHEFRCIKDVLSQSDLAVGNLETMLYPQAPYRNEKYVAEQNFHCNAPLEFLQAVRTAGFDVLTNANNHDMDTGAIGIGETIKYIEKFGFIHTGTFCDNRKRYQLIEVNGIKVAIVAFATEHNHKRCNLTKEGAALLLNDYSKAKAKRAVNDAKKEGADFVFCCIHWGQENKTTHNKSQEKIAKELADMGYDCIIGSHPHVLQDFDYIPTVEGKRVPVFYSMGNFVSHNSNCAKARTIVACIDIELEDGEPKLNCSYVPVFTSRSYKNDSFVVIPAGADSKDKDTRKKVRTISQVLGDKIDIATDIAYPDYIEDDCAKPTKKNSIIKPSLFTIKEFPYDYSEDKFRYSITLDGAVLVGFADASTNSYTVPAKVLDVPITQLADYAFANTTTIKKINFKKNIVSISTGLCQGCTSLEGIQMAETTREICDHAFHGCTKLSAVVIKSNVATVGSGAFADCTGLRTVKFKGMECSIADDAFDNCPMAVFYCAPGSQPERFALEHGFKVVNMIVE